MKLLFIQYAKCGTCQKAAKWLKKHQVEVTSRPIVEQRPSKEELAVWVERSGLPIAKFFNTSGKIYKENNLKEKVKTASLDELLSLLATDGMLVKRPLLVSDKRVLVGFKQEEWEEFLLKK